MMSWRDKQRADDAAAQAALSRIADMLAAPCFGPEHAAAAVVFLRTIAKPDVTTSELTPAARRLLNALPSHDRDREPPMMRAARLCPHCAAGSPHHTNSRTSIGGGDREVKRDLHEVEDASGVGLAECLAYDEVWKRIDDPRR